MLAPYFPFLLLLALPLRRTARPAGHPAQRICFTRIVASIAGALSEEGSEFSLGTNPLVKHRHQPVRSGTIEPGL